MQIRYYILKVKDVYEEVLKEVTSDLQKTCTMQKSDNQPAMQVNWLVATKSGANFFIIN